MVADWLRQSLSLRRPDARFHGTYRTDGVNRRKTSPSRMLSGLIGEMRAVWNADVHGVSLGTGP
jgi:hypothetical protein